MTEWAKFLTDAAIESINIRMSNRRLVAVLKGPLPPDLEELEEDQQFSFVEIAGQIEFKLQDLCDDLDIEYVDWPKDRVANAPNLWAAFHEAFVAAAQLQHSILAPKLCELSVMIDAISRM